MTRDMWLEGEKVDMRLYDEGMFRSIIMHEFSILLLLGDHRLLELPSLFSVNFHSISTYLNLALTIHQ
jgi:hypothetical protein